MKSENRVDELEPKDATLEKEQPAIQTLTQEGDPPLNLTKDNLGRNVEGVVGVPRKETTVGAGHIALRCVDRGEDSLTIEGTPGNVIQ